MKKLKFKDRLTRFFSKKEGKTSKLERLESNVNHINAEAPPRRYTLSLQL